MDISFSVDSEPPVPTTDSIPNLIKLRRLLLWHKRMEELVQARLKGLQGASAEKEYHCKKIVALCTGISVDKVDDVRISFYFLLHSLTYLSLSENRGFVDCGGKRIIDNRHWASIWFHAKSPASG